MNSITIKNENTGKERTVFTHQDITEIAQAAHQASLAISHQQQAYLVYDPGRGTFLCIQEGAGSRYHKIDTTCEQYNVEGSVMSGIFRYTGKPVRKQTSKKREEQRQ